MDKKEFNLTKLAEKLKNSKANKQRANVTFCIKEGSTNFLRERKLCMLRFVLPKLEITGSEDEECIKINGEKVEQNEFIAKLQKALSENKAQ